MRYDIIFLRNDQHSSASDIIIIFENDSPSSNLQFYIVILKKDLLATGVTISSSAGNGHKDRNSNVSVNVHKSNNESNLKKNLKQSGPYELQ